MFVLWCLTRMLLDLLNFLFPDIVISTFAMDCAGLHEN